VGNKLILKGLTWFAWYLLDDEARPLMSMQTPLNPDGLDLSMYSDQHNESVSCRYKGWWRNFELIFFERFSNFKVEKF